MSWNELHFSQNGAILLKILTKRSCNELLRRTNTTKAGPFS
jgi:hypothetical protein